ncbi:maltose alpha-D-glucosyltransferase [bacterium]|nr:maltose alpha-D-glucosyltransferase [bacterium]
MATPPKWYQNAIFYELYIRAFKDHNGDGNGDILGAIEKLDYLKHLGVDCIWILPTYPSPRIDDGYDISDYFGVHPDFGTLADMQRLIDEIHKRGMHIITDLVMNHTSDQHPWFQEARKGPHSPYHNYYVWSDTNTQYPLARVIFNDSLDSNWTWDEEAQQYYWHRFYPQQPDLNYDNPEVREQILKIIDFWLEMGIDGFRADAVPYLFEREGTNCDNLPETHEFLQRVRAHIDIKFPGRILLVEANQWPQDVLPYFGDSNEAHMAFHFPIMPRMYMSLKKEDRTSMVEILEQTPPIPPGAQWCTFLRNHDELTLEMVTGEERQWMWEQYAPEPRMRLNLGIRRRLAPLLDNDLQKIKLLNSMLFTFPGSPIIYYGDEIGMGDNIWLNDRNGVRTPMQWNDSPNAGFSDAPAETLYAPVINSMEFNPSLVNVAQQISDPTSLLNFIRRMIHTRKQFPAFSLGSLTWAELATDTPAIAAFWRTDPNETILAVHNLSARNQEIDIRMHAESQQFQEIFPDRGHFQAHDSMLHLSLSPHQFYWLKRN